MCSWPMLLTARHSAGLVYGLSSTSVLVVVSTVMPVAFIAVSMSSGVSNSAFKSAARRAASPGSGGPVTDVVQPAVAAAAIARTAQHRRATLMLPLVARRD